MVWPPPAMPTSRTNNDPVMDTHVADHNALALAMNDVVAHLEGSLAVRKQSSTSLSVPSSTWTALTTATVEYSYGQSIKGDSTSVMSDVGGLVLFLSFAQWNNSNGNGRRILGLTGLNDGSTPGQEYQDSVRGINTLHSQQLTMAWKITPPLPTWFVLWGYQDSGAALNVQVRRVTVLRLTHDW